MTDSSLKSSIPMQQKIAELEQRIATLEKRLTGIKYVHHEGAFGNKWRQLWKHFDEYFDEVFGR